MNLQMPAEPLFKNDKLEILVRKCIVFPADGSETRIVHMVTRTVTNEDILPLLYSRCVDMTSTFGDEYRKMRLTTHKIDPDGVQSTYHFSYNLSPNLPINLNVARVIGVTPSHLKTRKRLFWRGDVVAMKVQPESELVDFIVESLDANLEDLGPLEDFFRERYQDGSLECSLYYKEKEWNWYLSHYCWPTSLVFGPSTFYWGSNAVEKEENYLHDLNELLGTIGRPPLPRHVYMKSYTELACTFFAAFRTALCFHQKATGPPKLPLDLERRIFETCALESPEVCTVLVLVARRVHVWIDPILISAVRITDLNSPQEELFLAKLTNGKPVEYYVQHIKNLSILDISRTKEVNTNTILAICAGVENLALWARSDFFGNPHSGRNLRRLTIDLSRCFPFGSPPNFYHPCFANLTHLHLYDEAADWSTYPGWETLSSLTHLAFACSGSPETTMQLLQRLPAVRYVAFGSYKCSESLKYSDTSVDNRPGFSAVWGVRVVRLWEIPEHDWERGARGEGDFWDLVEQEVERRLEEGVS